LQSELRKQKNIKPKRQLLMLRRQPNRGADVKAEAEAEDKVQGGDEGGEGLWRVCLMNLGQRRPKGSQSCHHQVRNQLVNPWMMTYKAKERFYHPGQGHNQSG
jgi:hypothetical protein